MSHPHPTPQHREPADAWRERLVAAGWRAARGQPQVLQVRGRAYSLLPLGESPAGVALLCEPALGGALPDYAARREVRQHVGRLHPRNLALFVDGAWFARVWTWEERGPGGLRAYREEEGGGGPPAAALQALAAPPDAAWPPEVDPALARALFGRVLRALGEPEPGDADAQRVQRALEASTEVRPLRRAWRTLLGARLIDPACGTGAWLLGAAAVLEFPYLACLDRMRVWVHELERQRPPPRRDRLGDFRRLVQRAGTGEARRRFVRELVVYHNLWGADPDAGAVHRCRLRLLEWLRDAGGAEPLPEPAFACPVRHGDAVAGIRSARDLARLAGGAGSGAWLDDVRVVALARSELRRLHLQAGATATELSAGIRALHRHLDRVSARLAPPREAPVLHPVLEHAGLAGSRGARLVRGAAR